MDCSKVILTNEIIICSEIEPSKELPGFFYVQLADGSRQIINGQHIREVVAEPPENWVAQVI